MSERPRVPDWIRDFRCQDWTNIFDRLPAEEHLYGTETLFGDWNSRILLLAKDWGPASALTTALEEGDPLPWRDSKAGKGSRTNNRLKHLVKMIREENLLYGSATANMLYDDPRWSRSLPGFYSGQLHDFLKDVLSWVVESMPRVEYVACLGAEAWYLSCATIGDLSSATMFREHRDSHGSVDGTVANKKITLFPLYHPAARVSNESMEDGWRAFAADLKSDKSRLLSLTDVN